MGEMLTQLGAVDNGFELMGLDYFDGRPMAGLQRDFVLEIVVSWHENNPRWR